MALLFIDFEWWRCPKGYRLAPAEAPRKSEPVMHPVFGRPVPVSLLGGDPGKPQRVVPIDGRRVGYRPLERFGVLYRAFGYINTPDAVLNFIGNYGPLTQNGLYPSHGADVEFVLDQAQMFRSYLEAGLKRRKSLAEQIGLEGQKFANLEALITTDASGTLHLRILPRTLLGGLWLQLAQTLAGDMEIRRCGHCRKWFEAGVGTERRLDAKFCSDEHRIEFNSRKRSKRG